MSAENPNTPTPDNSALDAALAEIRDVITAKYGTELTINVDRLLKVQAMSANDARKAIGWRRVYQAQQDGTALFARARSYAAMFYGQVAATLDTMIALGLPVPFRTVDECLAHAAKVLADTSTADLIEDPVKIAEFSL